MYLICCDVLGCAYGDGVSATDDAVNTIEIKKEDGGSHHEEEEGTVPQQT